MWSRSSPARWADRPISKRLKGPFPYIPMMPTGGVSASNVADWFTAGVVAVGAGSELCPPELAKAGKFDEISQKAAEFVQDHQAARPLIDNREPELQVKPWTK